jgi:hypothetical protein
MTRKEMGMVEKTLFDGLMRMTRAFALSLLLATSIGCDSAETDDPVDDCVETDHLLAHYTFDGDVLDKSGACRDAVIGGNPTFVDGKYGSALRLDGEWDFIKIPEDVSPVPVTRMTIVMFFNMEEEIEEGNTGKFVYWNETEPEDPSQDWFTDYRWNTSSAGTHPGAWTKSPNGFSGGFGEGYFTSRYESWSMLTLRSTISQSHGNPHHDLRDDSNPGRWFEWFRNGEIGEITGGRPILFGSSSESTEPNPANRLKASFDEIRIYGKILTIEEEQALYDDYFFGGGQRAQVDG